MNPKHRILIVDDNVKMSETLSNILKTKDYEPIVFNKGEEALAMSKGKIPCVALIDLKLTDMPGLKVMKEIKKLSPDTECIVVTGYASQISAIEAVNLGAYGYVQKPFYNQQLLVIIKRAIEKYENKKALQASEEKYRLLVENANEAIIVTQDGITKFANPKATQLSGYSNEELTSKPFVELIHPDDREMMIEHHLKKLKGEKFADIHPFKYINKDGNTKWMEVNTVLTNWEEKPATLNFISDISELKRQQEELYQSYSNLQKTIEGTIQAMAKTTELRDPYTAGHQQRVTQLVSAIGKEIRLSKDKRKGLRMASIIHDIGKIQIPAEILSKPSKLTIAEYDILKAHPQAGYDILKNIEFSWPIAKIVLQHHERIDGSGYPQGLKKDTTLLEARIVAVADVVEAMSSHRPYRPALGIEKALEEIAQNKDILYDSQVVNACLKLFIKKKFKFEPSK